MRKMIAAIATVGALLAGPAALADGDDVLVLIPVDVVTDSQTNAETLRGAAEDAAVGEGAEDQAGFDFVLTSNAQSAVTDLTGGVDAATLTTEEQSVTVPFDEAQAVIQGAGAFAAAARDAAIAAGETEVGIATAAAATKIAEAGSAGVSAIRTAGVARDEARAQALAAQATAEGAPAAAQGIALEAAGNAQNQACSVESEAHTVILEGQPPASCTVPEPAVPEAPGVPAVPGAPEVPGIPALPGLPGGP